MSETPEQSIPLPIETCIGGTICAGYASLRAQVDEIPELLTIAHMQGAEHAKDQVQALRARLAELSGCEIDMQHYREKWQKAEARVDELSRAYAVQGLALEEEQARVAELEAALREAKEVLQLCQTQPTYPKNTPEYEPVRILCDRHGYGAVMACASSQWMEALTRQGLPLEGAHVSGPCAGTVTDTINLIARALGA